jgi:hypothetical protein
VSGDLPQELRELVTRPPVPGDEAKIAAGRDWINRKRQAARGGSLIESLLPSSGISHAELDRLEAALDDHELALKLKRPPTKAPDIESSPQADSGPTRDELMSARTADILEGGAGGEKAVGRRLGLSEASVQRWRKRHGLIPWPQDEPGEPGI